MTATKTCTKCGTVKPLTEFYKHSFGKHGLSSSCKACDNLARKSNYHASKPQPTQTDHVPNSGGCFVQAPPTSFTTAAGAPAWTPLKPSDLPQPVLRPGAMAHEKYGNRLPDGSIQPYRKPRCEPSYYQPKALQPRLNSGKFSNG